MQLSFMSTIKNMLFLSVMWGIALLRGSHLKETIADQCNIDRTLLSTFHL